MKKKIIWPTVSVIMPTLNSQRTLEESLVSITRQDYKGRMEILIADGGSIDRTIEIAKKYNTRIFKNNLKTAEAGKAVGARASKGEILAFIDSDNVLPSNNWLREMVKPFVLDYEIIASEPLYFTYRKADNYLTRYFALLGMGDPLNLFIGNFDKYSYISNSWTKLKLYQEDKGDYLLVFIEKSFPTVGANGFLVRKKIFSKYPIRNYFFDIDILKFLARYRPVKIAKVKVGIIHLFSGNVSTFVRKQRRRIKDYLYFRKAGIRADQEWGSIFLGIVKFIFFTILIIPLVYQSITGFLRKNDAAWFFHPVACIITLMVYSFEVFKSFFGIEMYGRKKWSQ